MCLQSCKEMITGQGFLSQFGLVSIHLKSRLVYEETNSFYPPFLTLCPGSVLIRVRPLPSESLIFCPEDRSA